jgi:hypothetical protein
MNASFITFVAGLVKEARRQKPKVLDQLLAAKRESDRKNYGRKHSILREVLKQRPGDFEVDSDSKGMVGLTHPSSGFRIHLPRRALPEAFLRVEKNRQLIRR